MMFYVLFYPSSIFLNKYIQPLFEYLFFIDLPIKTNNLVFFSIPTGIWAFCFIFSILSISNAIDWSFYLAVCLIIAPELMQHENLGLLKGTFDVNDLMINLIGIFIALYFTRKNQYK